MKSKLHSCIIKTPIGDMVAIADENVVISFDFVVEKTDYQISKKPSALLSRLEKEICEYFAQERQKFTLPLSPNGTEFQKKVWNTLLDIPYGSTISYATQAKMLQNPKATRAVANANGKNPITILIPCHRVIASNGSLGGYTGGVDKKEFLLCLEKEYFNNVNT